MNILSPLNISQKNPKPSFTLDTIPFLNIIVIGFFFCLLGSKFLMAPGLSVDLPYSPVSSIHNEPIHQVLTLKLHNQIFFQGKIYTLQTIEQALSTSLHNQLSSPSTLLIKMDKNISVEDLLRLCEIATSAGYAKVHVAANPQPTLSTLNEI